MTTDSMRSEQQSESSCLPCKEEALVRAAQSGDIKAFSTLVEKHQGLARAVAFSVCSDYSITDDLAQEALVTAWQRLSDLGDPAKFRPWLASIVRNTARYWRRHQGRHAPRAQYGQEVLELLPDGNSSPLDLALHKEEQSNVCDALEALSPRYKEPLLLYYCLGESHSEVASALGLSEAAARQRLCRARKKLKESVSSLERSGARLRTQASAAAAVMLLIHTQQVLAQSAAGLGNSVAMTSPKLFIGLGALVGAAALACAVAIVFIIAGNDSAASAKASFETSAPNSASIAEQGTASTETCTEILQDGTWAERRAPDPRALVRIGAGRVKDENARKGAAADLSRTASASSPVVAHDGLILRRGPETATMSGRIKKHGPARLKKDLQPEAPKALLRPSLDMTAVRRELWFD